MKHGLAVAIGAAVILGIIYVLATKNPAGYPSILQSRIQPGASLNNNPGGILSAVGPDLEDLIGVTPQGATSSYTSPYTPGGTVGISDEPYQTQTVPQPSNTLILASGSGLSGVPDYSDLMFDDSSFDE